MRLYVTGGTGFVGSNIVKVAVEQYGATVFTTVRRWRPEIPHDTTMAAAATAERLDTGCRRRRSCC